MAEKSEYGKREDEEEEEEEVDETVCLSNRRPRLGLQL